LVAPEPISCTQTAKARRLHGWKGELRKWVEQSIANEKPAFVAIMIGMKDRQSMQALVAARETNPPPVKPNERPVAGPVVPLKARAFRCAPSRRRAGSAGPRPGRRFQLAAYPGGPD